ncbi:MULTISPECIES: hypothetical protein [Bacillus cereus group]|nr:MULTISPECIES: hypothetical protein [Bacillus cereus group]
MPTDIHLPPKIGVSHLHIFEEGFFWRKTINETAVRDQTAVSFI